MPNNDVEQIQRHTLVQISRILLIDTYFQSSASLVSSDISMLFLTAAILLIPLYSGVKATDAVGAVLLPLYIYPNPSIHPHPWTPLYNALGNHTQLGFDIIINPDSGPTHKNLSDPELSDYLTALQHLKTFPNARVLGYVHAGFGDTSLQNDLLANISRYAAWANNNPPIHLDGIFIDESPITYSTPSVNVYMNLAIATSHARSSYLDTIILNPRQPADSRYFDIADSVVWFDGPYSQFNLGVFTALDERTRANCSALIRTFPAVEMTQSRLIPNLVSAHMGSLGITTADDYHSLSALWEPFVRYLDLYINDD